MAKRSRGVPPDNESLSSLPLKGMEIDKRAPALAEGGKIKWGGLLISLPIQPSTKLRYIPSGGSHA